MGRGNAKNNVRKIKDTRTVTYRRFNREGYIPAVILEGRWLERLYGWKIGDRIGVELRSDEIRLKTKDSPKEILCANQL